MSYNGSSLFPSPETPSHGLIQRFFNNSHRVVKYDTNGELLVEWGGEGNEPGEFRSPAGVALDQDGLIYIADKGNNRCSQPLRFDRLYRV